MRNNGFGLGTRHAKSSIIRVKSAQTAIAMRIHLKKTQFFPTRFSFRVGLSLILLSWLFWLSLVSHDRAAGLVYAQDSTPFVITFNASTNLIELDSTESDDVMHAISIPEVANYLAQLGHPNLVTEMAQDEWLLSASISVQAGVRLEMTDATVAALRLQSNPSFTMAGETVPLPYNFIRAEAAGHLLIDGIVLSSWDSTVNAVDENIEDGRSYILAYRGGRVDILRSEISHLGWAPGEESGLAWHQRMDVSDASTGATGHVAENRIHHNYFGLYSFEAYGLSILNNDVYQNHLYGIDPHDDSQELEIAFNRVYQNGSHGIILSRRCINNLIHNNEVYENVGHGIMLDRGSNYNVVKENKIYQNSDGLAIYQSSHNVVRANQIFENKRGVRINATFDDDDDFDAVATDNLVEDNVIDSSTEFGIYLYERADQNLIRANKIMASGVSGIYIKSGGNRIEGNQIYDGENGITIFGAAEPATASRALPSLMLPGHHNIILGSDIRLNRNAGIRILGGVGNEIGQASAVPNGTQRSQSTNSSTELFAREQLGNRIVQNGNDGIAIRSSSAGQPATDNVIAGNRITENGRYGVHIESETSVRNTISENTLAANQRANLNIIDGAQEGILPPTILGRSATDVISGTATAGATVEIYSDIFQANLSRQLSQRLAMLVSPAESTLYVASKDGFLHNDFGDDSGLEDAVADIGLFKMVGRTSADENGVWYFELPAAQQYIQVTDSTIHLASLKALAIDTDGNTSGFSNAIVWLPGLSYQIQPNDNDQPTLYIYGENERITFADIRTLFQDEADEYIEEVSDGVWRLKINLVIGEDTTLDIDEAGGVAELQLRSEATPLDAVTVADDGFDYTRFVYLATYSGTINITGTHVYSWDSVAESVDTDINNGRSYLLARFDAALNFADADVGYLGFADGQSYGVSWRDTNPDDEAQQLRTRVTGSVINSQFHHNYYGIYTFQASGMTFRGNHFHNNIRYGFDPHDFSHDFLVEDNDAYQNGSHGIIISRGCHNITFRNNRSYGNVDPGDNLAHGFMLGPGSPNSRFLQEPSNNNRFENNEAFNNEGYGVRVLASNQNVFVGNNFHHNLRGLVFDPASTGNVVRDNTLSHNANHGLVIREMAHGNTIDGNVLEANGEHGINVLSNNNVIQHNMVMHNQKSGLSIRSQEEFEAVTGSRVFSNTVKNNAAHGVELKGVQNTLLTGNMIHDNGQHGITLSRGTSSAIITQNSIYANLGDGIRTSDVDTLNNSWNQNQIYANSTQGINNTSSANNGIIAPEILRVEQNWVQGTAQPGMYIDIYSDDGNGGRFFEGSTTAGETGLFELRVEAEWQEINVTAIATDVSGSSSEFAAHLTARPAMLYIYMPLVEQ